MCDLKNIGDARVLLQAAHTQHWHDGAEIHYVSSCERNG